MINCINVPSHKLYVTWLIKLVDIALGISVLFLIIGYHFCDKIDSRRMTQKQVLEKSKSANSNLLMHTIILIDRIYSIYYINTSPWHRRAFPSVGDPAQDEPVKCDRVN